METVQREELIVAVCHDLFWSSMARSPENRVELTRSSANDLLFSCLLNRQISWTSAMGAIGELKYRAGIPDALHLLLSLSPAQVEHLMFDLKPALHRYRYMAGLLVGCAEHLRDNYGGDTREIFADNPLASQAVQRVKAIRGMGDKLASLFVRIAVLQNGVSLWDGYGGLQVSCDVHVRRVGAVLGLWQEDAPAKEIEAVAAALAPTEPVILDSLFIVGIEWHFQPPQCNHNDEGLPCPLREVCPQARAFPR